MARPPGVWQYLGEQESYMTCIALTATSTGLLRPPVRIQARRDVMSPSCAARLTSYMLDSHDVTVCRTVCRHVLTWQYDVIRIILERHRMIGFEVAHGSNLRAYINSVFNKPSEPLVLTWTVHILCQDCPCNYWWCSSQYATHNKIESPGKWYCNAEIRSNSRSTAKILGWA